MLRTTMLTLLLISTAAGACPGGSVTKVATMSVPNVRDKQPACQVEIARVGEQCADGSCTLPRLKGAKSEPAKVSFSCIPLHDQTGFENPSPEMKVTPVRHRSGTGHLGVSDYAHAEGEKPAQDISFCLSGKVNYLCGSARVDKGKGKGKQPPEVKQVQALIKRIDFKDDAAR